MTTKRNIKPWQPKEKQKHQENGDQRKCQKYSNRKKTHEHND